MYYIGVAADLLGVCVKTFTKMGKIEKNKDMNKIKKFIELAFKFSPY